MQLFNTIILGDHAFLLRLQVDAQDYYFRNNIFCGKRAHVIAKDITIRMQNIVFDNNLYTGGATAPNGMIQAGRKEFPAEDHGFIITDKNRAVDGVFAATELAFPEFTSTRAEAIAAYTPQVKIDGAYETPATVDINGTPITTPFYGCVAY